MTKDFTKAILREDKDLLKMSEVKFVHVPKYEELSVKHLFPLLKE